MKNRSRTRIVYGYINPAERQIHYRDQLNKILGFYSNKEQPMILATLSDLFAKEEDVLIPFQVYDNQKDLPVELIAQIRPKRKYRVPNTLPPLGPNEVYAILANTDFTEGGGFNFIVALVTNFALAKKISATNGPSGSDADIIIITLDQDSKRENPINNRRFFIYDMYVRKVLEKR